MKTYQRRERELEELRREGLPIEQVTRWHWRVGTLELWPAVGRWNDLASGEVGKMQGTSMRKLVEMALRRASMQKSQGAG